MKNMNTTKITQDKETGEYRVRLFIDGVYQSGTDYYTDDKEDCIITAKHMEKTGVESDKNNHVSMIEDIEWNIENESFYYVCNDYSLEICNHVPEDIEKYHTRKEDEKTLYIHTEYNEIHYCSIEKRI